MGPAVMARTNSAFSLIELMIALAIVAILATIGVPLYLQHVTTLHRADGQIALLQLSGRLENYYLQQHTYNGATFSVLKLPEHSPEGFYRLAIVLENDGQSYQIQAIPQGIQAKDDQACGTLELSTDGRRSSLGPGPNSHCW